MFDRKMFASIFRPSSSDPSRPGRDKVLEIGPLFVPLLTPLLAGLLAGWLCNFGSNKSDLNPGANSVKLFLSEP